MEKEVPTALNYFMANRNVIIGVEGMVNILIFKTLSLEKDWLVVVDNIAVARNSHQVHSRSLSARAKPIPDSEFPMISHEVTIAPCEEGSPHRRQPP